RDYKGLAVLVIKIFLLLSLSTICFQDIKAREVYWFLFPIIGILSGYLHYINTFKELFLASIVINVSFVLILIILIFIYSKLKLKKPMSETFALGDCLFFLAIAFSFSSISFLITFIFSLIFSLLIHLILKRNSKFTTVPLAGYMSLFYILIYLSMWTGLVESLYIL